MANYTLSKKAQFDIENIYQYTKSQFGQEQAATYLQALHSTLEVLAEETEKAVDVSDIRQGYLRYLFRKHSIFFKKRKHDIFVTRILHQQMKVEIHLTS